MVVNPGSGSLIVDDTAIEHLVSAQTSSEIESWSIALEQYVYLRRANRLLPTEGGEVPAKLPHRVCVAGDFGDHAVQVQSLSDLGARRVFQG